MLNHIAALDCLQAVLSEHSAEVVGVALHPTNKYFITASVDKSWAFYDLDSMLCMAQVQLPSCHLLALLAWTCCTVMPGNVPSQAAAFAYHFGCSTLAVEKYKCNVEAS